MEQWFIYRDIYETLKNPTRPMHAIDLPHLQSKTYFDDAVSVIERMGLTELAILRCNYNPCLIMQFFATLVIMPNAQKTMKWMSGENYCELDFSVFASLLGYAFDGENLVGRRVHSPGTKPDEDKLVVSMIPPVLFGFVDGCFHFMISLSAFLERILPLDRRFVEHGQGTKRLHPRPVARISLPAKTDLLAELCQGPIGKRTQSRQA
jgi:hypothetical protein